MIDGKKAHQVLEVKAARRGAGNTAAGLIHQTYNGGSMNISTSPESGTASVLEHSETSSKPQRTERKRGAGNIYLRGSVYWICYWRRGRRFRESSGSEDPAIAQRKLDKRTKEIWAERQGLAAFVPKAEKTYVDELLDALLKDYKLNGGRGLSQFSSHLKPIREAFGDMRAVDVTSKVVDDYIDACLAGNHDTRAKAPTTINRETQLLGQAFALGIQRRLIVTAPHIRHLPERNVRQGFFEKAEFEVVVTHLPEYLQDFCRFAYLCAWRKGQIASLTWADVDRNAGVIVARAENVKNGRAHKIALEAELAEIIERRWAARDYKTTDGNSAVSQYVFHLDGRPVGDFRKAWASTCKAAGLVKPKLDHNGKPVTITVDGQKAAVVLPSRLFHDLRRSAVRNMVRAGVREGVAMSISGHRTRAIFDRYNITSDEDLRQAVRQTTEHLAAQPAERKIVSIRK
jgi:integrase